MNGRFPRQVLLRGINLGALLVLVGALKATLHTSGLHPEPDRGLTALGVMTGMLLLILLPRPVLRAAHALFFKGDKRADTGSLFGSVARTASRL